MTQIYVCTDPILFINVCEPIRLEVQLKVEVRLVLGSGLTTQMMNKSTLHLQIHL